MNKRIIVDITCKLWGRETDWFKDMCWKEFECVAVDASKYVDPREQMVLGCSTVFVRGLKDNIDNLRMAIRERNYDIDVTNYKECKGWVLGN